MTIPIFLLRGELRELEDSFACYFGDEALDPHEECHDCLP